MTRGPCFFLFFFFVNISRGNTAIFRETPSLILSYIWLPSLLWRHNGHDGVSNHQPHDCLLNRLFRRRSKKTWNLRVTGLCVENSPGTGEFPAQMASNAENVFIWWRHHDGGDTKLFIQHHPGGVDRDNRGVNSLVTGRWGSDFTGVFFDSFYELTSSAVPVKLVLGESHRTPIMIPTLIQVLTSTNKPS